MILMFHEFYVNFFDKISYARVGFWKTWMAYYTILDSCNTAFLQNPQILSRVH